MPITAYGAGKATAEIYLSLYRMLHGVDCRVARISNPFGAGQAVARGQGAVTTFLDRALNKQPIVIWGDGEVVRDYIHITDVAEAIVALALRADLNDFDTYNIGSGVGLSLNNIIDAIEAFLNQKLEVRREPGRAFDMPISVWIFPERRHYWAGSRSCRSRKAWRAPLRTCARNCRSHTDSMKS